MNRPELPMATIWRSLDGGGRERTKVRLRMISPSWGKHGACRLYNSHNDAGRGQKRKASGQGVRARPFPLNAALETSPELLAWSAFVRGAEAAGYSSKPERRHSPFAKWRADYRLSVLQEAGIAGSSDSTPDGRTFLSHLYRPMYFGCRWWLETGHRAPLRGSPQHQ